jgi:MoxR-like ATPase
VEEKLISQSLVRFYWLREQSEIRKKPSTSELVDWIGALVRGGIEPKQLEKELPFLGVLLKKESDLQALRQSHRRNSRF